MKIVSNKNSNARRGALAVLLLVVSLLIPFQRASIAQSAAAAGGGVRRVVIIKIDGLPQWFIDAHVREIDPATNRSRLPWINHVFYENGTRLNNFYVRGTSISAPSWSMLDTGQHMSVRGNVEFDRLTFQTYDYLNFFPFYFLFLANRQVDMPGTRVLDEIGVPLLLDAYPYDERQMSFQLYQRGLRWTTLQRALQNHFTPMSPREMIDEWTMGIDWTHMLFDRFERELILKLNDPRIRYLDFYSTGFDHVAHSDRDPRAQLRELQLVDETIGRVWTAIERTPQAAETALFLLSDHGINTDARTYSQGFNLVHLLGSAAGGGHHVGTKRRLMQDYALKGINPFTPIIISTSPQSFYLQNQSADYPTALLDFDGNERATIHLRDSDFNTLHILLQQLGRHDLSHERRQAAIRYFFDVIDWRRADWTRMATEINEELGALRREIVRLRGVVAAQPREWTQADRDAGRDQDSRRHAANLRMAEDDERGYTRYLLGLSNLLALNRETFDARTARIEDLILPRVLGEANSLHELQNYVSGLAPGGLVLDSDGRLDATRSFVRVNYFQMLRDARVRNNVQPNVDNHPVDFVAVRVPPGSVRGLSDAERADEIVWLYGSEDRQALILSRTGGDGQTTIRYLPITRLRQDEEGDVTFERTGWRAGLPLGIWEDENFALSVEVRAAWLNEWHTDTDWLRAAHRTHHSNAVIGLQELFARHFNEELNPNAPNLSADERLMRRFRVRQRLLTETDLFVHANNHWNFDVKGFNPGGNHGSFYRASTHSALMMAGGARTNIPRGLAVEEPYDSLSFVPTVLTLTGGLSANGQITPALYRRGFRPFPGRVIEEVIRRPANAPRIAADR